MRCEGRAGSGLVAKQSGCAVAESMNITMILICSGKGVSLSCRFFLLLTKSCKVVSFVCVKEKNCCSFSDSTLISMNFIVLDFGFHH